MPCVSPFLDVEAECEGEEVVFETESDNDFLDISSTASDTPASHSALDNDAEDRSGS